LPKSLEDAKSQSEKVKKNQLSSRENKRLLLRKQISSIGNLVQEIVASKPAKELWDAGYASNATGGSSLFRLCLFLLNATKRNKLNSQHRKTLL